MVVRGSRQRWTSVAATALTVLASILVAIPATVALTPAQETTVAGQYVGVGAATPTVSWAGPAQLQQIGKTTVDLERVQVRGPLRPRLELGPLVQTREASQLLDPRSGPAARERALDNLTDAVRDWFVWATVLLVLLALAVITLATLVRIWVSMARASRRDEQLTMAEAWSGRSRRLRRTAIGALAATLVVWAGSAVLTFHDTRDGLAGVSSIRELVGAAPVSLQAAGPPVEGYTGAVIGDSRASRLGGPLVDDPTADDRACGRSSDSLASQLTRLMPGERVLNLACPSATTERGLLGLQERGGRTLQPQVSRLLQAGELDFVVVMIGPNDLNWTDFLRYCYGVSECDDRFTADQFDYRLAEFDRSYGDLLAALATLPGEPEVVVVGSYDVFDLDADCADTDGPEGVPGLDEDGLAVLEERNDTLNEVLTAGAEAYGFPVALPQLVTLCAPVDPEVGRDLQGLEDEYPFHPTGVGMVRLAASVLAAIGE